MTGLVRWQETQESQDGVGSGGGGGGISVASVEVQRWMVALELYRPLELKPEGVLLSTQNPSPFEGEAVASVHDVFTDC